MNDKQRRARLALVESGLRALLKYKHLRRSEFFTLDEFSPTVKNVDVIASEQRKKLWQKGVLERLIKHGLIYETRIQDQNAYAISNEALINEVLEDHRNSGIRLAWFVFPREVPEGAPPGALEEETEEPGEEEVATPETPEEPAEGAQREITMPLDVAGSFITALGEMSKSHKRLLAGVDALTAEVKELREDRVKLEEEKGKRLSAEYNSLNHLVHGNSKRLSDLEESVRDTHKLLESSHKMIKDHLNNVLEIERSAQSMVEAAISTTALNKDLGGLTQAFDAFVGEYRAARDDKLSVLIGELKKQLEQGKNLYDMVLEVASDEANQSAGARRVKE